MKSRKEHSQKPSVAPVVERNIRALGEHRQKASDAMTWNERLALAISGFAATGVFLLAHVLIIGGWIVINLGLVSGVAKFDPNFTGLAATVSVEAIFLSTFILMTQRRMMKDADERAHLNLQISLLAEHEITRVLILTKALAKNFGVDEAQHPDLEELEKDTAPGMVLEAIDKHEKKFSH